MNQEEIKAKSAALAELYTAKANGKTLQLFDVRKGWVDCPDDHGPTMGSDLSRWRVKPEPRRMWVSEKPGDDKQPFTVQVVWNEADADHLMMCGFRVTEWNEVLP